MNWKYYKPKFEYEEKFQDLKWSWAGHKYFAYDLVLNMKPVRIVELGTHMGTSFFSFCQAVKDGKLKTELNAVDTWKGDEHAGFYDESVFEKIKEIKKSFYDDLNINLVRKTFNEALADFEDKSIDLLHIDGLHTYEAVKHDFDSWFGKVKRNGIIILHDVTEKTGDFGVYKLWGEIKEKYKTLEFQHSHGLGILFLKPEKYKTIFDFQEIWQQYYTLFADNRYIKHELKNIGTEVLEKDNEIKVLNVLTENKNRELLRIRDYLRQKDEQINILRNGIQQNYQEISSLNQTIQQNYQEISSLNQTIQQKDQEINLMKSSKFWILRNRYIKLKNFKLEHFVQLVSRAFRILQKDGFRKFLWATYKYAIHGRDYFRPKKKPKTDYEKWMEKNERRDKKDIEKKIESFQYKPKISIITPVYNVDPKWLDKCIESVQNQFYGNWELCMHDDASTKRETVECLKKWQEKGDKRIKITYGKENQHISGASNEALKLATGEFVALLDNDDELSPDALYENVKLLNAHPEADFIYSDEDKIDGKSQRIEPFFKPDWSPDLFLSQMYTCHLGVYRKSIVDEIGGFRKGYEGSQDYDLVLRFIEKTNRDKIYHIPKILYHWRKIAGSMAGKETAKDYTSDAAKKALRNYLERNEIQGEVLDGKFPGTYRVKRKIIGNSKVSIIIPFKDQAKVTKVCIDSIFKKTDYENFEIILVNNQSKEKETFDYLKSLKKNPRVKVLDYDKPFNYSAINNFAVRQATGEYILFLNNDIEAISGGWLSAMLEHAQRKGVGAVGAKLLYPNETIQHAGVVMGPGGIAGHSFKHLPDGSPGYFFHPHLIKNYNVVTAACMLIKKDVFNEVGGLDDTNLPIAFNDVDLCLKIREAGYLVIWTPYAKLYHHESLSRGNDEDFKNKDPQKYTRVMAERLYIKKKWSSYISNDPFYNPNLTKEKEDFSIKIDK